MKYRLNLFAVVLTVCCSSQAIGSQMSGSSIGFTTTYSSQGTPCESDCWEVWQSNTSLGTFMVVKDTSGLIVEAGRIVDSPFADYFAMVDEANRKIPMAMRITRWGVVRWTSTAQACDFLCVVTADFGAVKDIVFSLNQNGKVQGVHQVDDALLDPPPQVNPVPQDASIPYCPLPGDGPRANCQSVAGRGVYRGGQHPLGASGTLVIYYNEFGQPTHFEIIWDAGGSTGKIEIKGT